MNSSSSDTTFFKLNAVLLCSVNVIFTFVGIFLNSVVITSLLCSQLRRKLCYFMILFLACCDLAVAVVFHPMIILETILYWSFTSFANSIKVPYITHLFVFSLTTLLTMTVERCLALVYPFFHQKFVTKSRLTAVFVLLQLPFGIFYIIRVNESDEYIESAIILALIGTVLLVICCLNYKIFYIARTARNRAIIPLGSLNGFEPKSGDAWRSISALRKVSTCLLAVACLLVCYCPSIVYFGYVLSGKQAYWSDQTLRMIELWARTLASLNSSLNCLIFFYKNSALRRHGETMLQKCFCARSRLFE